MTRHDLFARMAALVEGAPPGVLATIATVSGSSPAPALSRMLVPAIGESVGTVGGGCIEAEVAREAQRVRAEGGWAHVAFTLTESDEEIRMVCGGTVEILLERLDAADVPLLQTIARRHVAGQASLLARVFPNASLAATGRSLRVRARGAEGPARMLYGEEGELLWGRGALPADLAPAVLRAIHGERAAWLRDGAIFLEPIAARPRLILFGGGHVSRAVAAIAAAAGFAITVIDDRERYIAPDRFPDATRIAAPGYADLAARVSLAPNDFLVVATRGHQFDEEVLDQLLRLPATRYLGVIGSRRKHEMARRHLLERGIDAGRLDALRAPVGLDIGAVTPEEIGLAIVAEMVAVRRGAPARAALPLSSRGDRGATA